MSVTLQHVVDQLKVNNLGIDSTAKNIDALVQSIERSRLDGLEDKLKKSRAKPAVPERSKAFQAGEKLGGGFNIAALLNPTKILLPLLAGVTAFGAGIAGLRGWEVGALKKIGTGINTLGDLVSKGAATFRNNLLAKIFGLDTSGKPIRSIDGRFAKAVPLTDQIADAIKGFKTSALLMFGIGADGKPINVQGADGKFKGTSTSGTFITKATARISKLLRPIIAVSTGIADFVKGTGKGLFKFLDPFISGGKSFLKLFGKILWPVGVIMSLFESVTAYQNEDGSKFEKFKEGFGTFFADFLGAPLDLLKSGMVWIMRKLLGVEVDEDGKIKPGQGIAGDALAILQKFSFKEAIKSLIDGVFSIGESAFKWFSDLFSGEKSIGESLGILWKAWLGAATSIGDWIWNKAIAPITEWFASKLGIELDLPELNLKEMLTNTYARIKNGFMSSMESLAIWFTVMPKRIGLSLEEEWIHAIAKLKVGFVKFGEWISGLPDSIFLGSLTKLKETVPNWASKALGLDDAIASAGDRLANRQSGLDASLERIDYTTAKKLGDLNERRSDLESYNQQLLDARQYNTTNVNNSGGIVMDAATPTTDNLGGGSAYAFVGGAR